MKNLNNHENFIYKDREIVLLELVVGFNILGIIRYPFEVMTERYETARLIRINMNEDRFSIDVSNKFILLKMDIQATIKLLF